MGTEDLKQLALFRWSAIGDIVMMVPLVRALQRSHLNLDMTWITGRLAYSLLEGLSGIDFIVIDKPHSLLDFLTLSRQLQHASYDILLAAQASLRVHIVYPLIKATRKIGFDRQRARDAHGLFVKERIEFGCEHLIDSFMRFAQALGVQDTALEWNLPIDEQQKDWAKRQLAVKSGPWLAINPMAGKRERRWPLECYAQAIDRIVDRWKVNIVLTGGPSVEEKTFSHTIADKTTADCLVLTGHTNLKQMAALLGAVDVVLAPDTGPVHIATAMNTPVVGLYAVAPPELSGPYLSQHLVVNRYPDAVAHILKKDPDTIAWGKRVHSLDAMKLITVEDVIQKLGVVL